MEGQRGCRHRHCPYKSTPSHQSHHRLATTQHNEGAHDPTSLVVLARLRDRVRVLGGDDALCRAPRDGTCRRRRRRRSEELPRGHARHGEEARSAGAGRLVVVPSAVATPA